jgi:hypothetical protein
MLPLIILTYSINSIPPLGHDHFNDSVFCVHVSKLCFLTEKAFAVPVIYFSYSVDDLLGILLLLRDSEMILSDLSLELT